MSDAHEPDVVLTARIYRRLNKEVELARAEQEVALAALEVAHADLEVAHAQLELTLGELERMCAFAQWVGDNAREFRVMRQAVLHGAVIREAEAVKHEPADLCKRCYARWRDGGCPA